MAIPFINSLTTSAIVRNAKLHLVFHPISIPHKPNNLLVSCTPPSLGLELGLCLSVGTHFIPHPDKVEKGGEDAYFVSSHGGGVIAVADGVSGWKEKDVNPALFSRELISNASVLVQDEEVNYDPRILIRKAHAATSSVGSATSVIAMLERNGILKIANVGDCGVKVIRKGVCAFAFCGNPRWLRVIFCRILKLFSTGQIVFATYPQEHYFDCPYQLSSEADGQTFIDATVTTVELMEEDTIVMGTDGLFDNVYDREIVLVIKSCNNVSNAAKELANLAHNHSKDSSFDSPYSQEARIQGFDVPWWKKIVGMKLTGGKLDDITVIVAEVKSSLG